VTDDTQPLKKTALYNEHVKLGAKMVPFAGFLMPVVYSSIIEEHTCVRTAVGLFDVSHMGEFRISGQNALDLIQKVTINDASKLEVRQVQYSAMCYHEGGIVDDLLVYRFEDHYMLVVNASNIDKDFAWIQENMIDGAKLENISDTVTLIAVQGPKSRELLQQLTGADLAEQKYYRTQNGDVAGVPAILSRTGYTGELGFEIYISAEHSVPVWNALLEKGAAFGVKPVGLGARDTLRLEKKMCLYGNDITKDTNPLEAGLGWITRFDKGEFNGRSALAAVREKGITRKLVGFESLVNAVPRHGYEIVKDGTVIGEVTSGTFSPMLKKGIGMGYVAAEYAAAGTEITFRARGRDNPARIVKMPFV